MNTLSNIPGVGSVLGLVNSLPLLIFGALAGAAAAAVAPVGPKAKLKTKKGKAKLAAGAVIGLAVSFLIQQKQRGIFSPKVPMTLNQLDQVPNDEIESALAGFPMYSPTHGVFY